MCLSTICWLKKGHDIGNKHHPNITALRGCFTISSAEEVVKLSIPDIDVHPRLLFIRESIRIRRIAASHRKDAVDLLPTLNIKEQKQDKKQRHGNKLLK